METRRVKGLRMSADDVSWWANWILVGALLLGVAATYAIVVSGNIKEASLKKELQEKDRALEAYKLTVEGQVAEAKSEGIKAGEKASNALLRAAELENEAAAARLETERIKATVEWRILSPDMLEKLQSAAASDPQSINIQYTEGDPEAMYLAMQFYKVFNEARWIVGFGSKGYLDTIVFGVSVPEGPKPGTEKLRSLLTAAEIPFGTVAPVATMNRAAGTKVDGPTLIIGSKSTHLQLQQ